MLGAHGAGRLQSRLPRSAIGYNLTKNLLYLIMVEGYEIDHSEGISQHKLAEFLINFGASHAMELDGGGSSGLWVGTGFVNDFSDGERPLSNALLLFWDETD